MSQLDTVGARLGAAQASYSAYGRPKPGFEGYYMYQFLDKEPNLLPYTVGTWLGTKRVFNLGAGIAWYKDAMWTPRMAPQPAAWDTAYHDMLHLGLDIFWDEPLGPEGRHVFTLYASYINYNFGPNYLRSFGTANPAEAPATGTWSAKQLTASGPGNSVPLLGTGHAVYTLAGMLLPPMGKLGRLQPYASVIVGDYARMQQPVMVPDVGCNWYMSGHHCKVTLNWRPRPVYDLIDKSNPRSQLEKVDTKNEVTMQFHVYL